MFSHWISSWRVRRAARHRQADALIAEHGPESWSVARVRAFACGIGTLEFDEAWKIGCLVERKLKIDHMPDTATRYLRGRS